MRVRCRWCCLLRQVDYSASLPSLRRGAPLLAGVEHRFRQRDVVGPCGCATDEPQEMGGVLLSLRALPSRRTAGVGHHLMAHPWVREQRGEVLNCPDTVDDAGGALGRRRQVSPSSLTPRVGWIGARLQAAGLPRPGVDVRPGARAICGASLFLRPLRIVDPRLAVWQSRPLGARLPFVLSRGRATLAGGLPGTTCRRAADGRW